MKLEDLITTDEDGNEFYDYSNKWNGELGAMHLQCPPNSLGAEVNLGSSATVVSFLKKDFS